MSAARALRYHVNIRCFKVNIIKRTIKQAPTQHKPLRIAVLAYPGCMGAQVFGIAEVLGIAMDIAGVATQKGAPSFAVQIVALQGRTVRIAGGIAVSAARARGRYDLLIVPGLEISRQVNWSDKLAPLAREVAFIRKTFASGTPVASVCVGAFLLGEAGLLQGRAATTAWLFASALAERYPLASVQGDAAFVEDSAVTTTGAVSSAFDLALHLIKQHLGAEVATATARVALLPGQRASQAPFVDRQMMRQQLPAFSHSLTQWFQHRLTEDYDLQRVAKAFHVSASTLMRRTKAETGQSPLTLLQHARVDKAKHLLLSTAWGIDRITEAVGYADATTFSRLFARVVGETPARFRRRNLTP